MTDVSDDINQFVELFPSDTTIADIVYTYVAGSQKARYLITFIESEKFKSYWESLTSSPEYEAVISYLKDIGLEFSVILKTLSRISGIESIGSILTSSPSNPDLEISGGLKGFLKDVYAVFPADAIAQLREDRIVNSPAFANFTEKITSQAFLDLLVALKASEAYQNLIQLVLSRKVEIIEFINLFASAVGLGTPRVIQEESVTPVSSTFTDHLFDFFKLILANEKAVKLGKAYLTGDSEVQGVFNYLNSDGFSELVSTLKENEEFIAIKNYLAESGFDIKAAYNRLRVAVIRYAVLGGYFSGSDDAEEDVEIVGGIQGFATDFADAIPVAEIETLHQEKLENSPDFANFVENIKSDEFKNLLAALKENEDFHNISEKLKEAGVSYQRLFALLGSIVGLAIEL